MINNPLIDTKLKRMIMDFPKKFKMYNQYNRLDIISYKLYNDVNYWYILAFYNGIVDPFDIKEYEYIYFIPYKDLIEILNKT